MIGTEVMNGVTCERWEYVTAIGDRSNRYTLWLQRQVCLQRNRSVSIF